MQESFRSTHVENPSGLLGLMSIIGFAFLISAWLRQKGKAAGRRNREGNARHPAVRLGSAYLDARGTVDGWLAIFLFLVLLVMSKK